MINRSLCVETKKIGNAEILHPHVKPSRNTNIEILRIISMLMIIAYHAVGVGYKSKEASFIVYAGGQILGSWGILGVDIFLIISVWFLSDLKFRILKVFSIVFQTFTWVFAYSMLSVIYDMWKTQSVTVSVANFCKDIYSAVMQPLWSDCYWFVTAYVFILLISPFLNKLLNTASQENCKKILIVFIFIPIYSQFRHTVVVDITYFVYCYILIGYIKRYGCAFLTRIAKPGFFTFIAVIVVIAKLICYIPETSIVTELIESVLINTVAADGRHSMIMLFIALLVFFWVIRLKPHCNKFVNTIASYTLGVYLFHENEVLRFPKMVKHIFYNLTEIGFIGTSVLFPLQYLAATIIVFIVGAVIEYFRQLIIQKPFMKLLTVKCSARFEKIDAWFSEI